MSYRNQLEEIGRPQGMPVMVAPVHLKRLLDICTTFGRTEETVKKWRKEGAPIAFDGSSYSAEYNQLMAWLVGRQVKGASASG